LAQLEDKVASLVVKLRRGSIYKEFSKFMWLAETEDATTERENLARLPDWSYAKPERTQNVGGPEAAVDFQSRPSI